jgi:alpha-1,6-mannosyltransferase
VALRKVALIGLGSGVAYAVIAAAERAMALARLGGAMDMRWPVAYLAATAALFALYWDVVSMASRDELRGRARTLALAVPLLVNVALVGGRPQLSIDVLSYVAQGHQANAGQNPYAEPSKALAGTAYGANLSRFGWIPVHGVSPYGPMWTRFEAAVDRWSPDVAVEILVIKIVVAGFSLGCAWLVWLIAGRVAPRSQLAATLLYLWNPVVVAEFAGEGHNDAALIFFVLLTLYLCLRGRTAASVLALVAGSLVKITALTIAPLEAVYAWRTNRDRRRLIAGALAAGACGVALAAVMYAPFWIGRATFDGIRTHGRPSVLASTPGVLYWYLIQSHSEEASARLISLVMTSLFAGVIAMASMTVRDPWSLLRAAGRVAVVYLVLAPGYWPWYAAMPVALLALTPDRSSIAAIFAVSVGSRLAAPIDTLRLGGVMDWQTEVFIITIVGIWLPALAAAAVTVHESWVHWTHAVSSFTWRGSAPTCEPHP